MALPILTSKEDTGTKPLGELTCSMDLVLQEDTHKSPKLKVSVLLLNFSWVSLVNGDAGVFELPFMYVSSL